MAKIIRQGMFETNSSTCHTCILDFGAYIPRRVSRGGQIIIRLGYYDNKTPMLVTSREKLNWLVTMLFSSVHGFSEKDMFDSDLEDFIESKQYDLDKIKEVVESVEGPVEFKYQMEKGCSQVGMNHQLRGEWYGLDDYLRSCNVSLKDFIYSDKVKVDFYQD